MAKGKAGSQPELAASFVLGIVKKYQRDAGPTANPGSLRLSLVTMQVTLPGTKSINCRQRNTKATVRRLHPSD
jgi:hypothetical protein